MQEIPWEREEETVLRLLWKLWICYWDIVAGGFRCCFPVRPTESSATEASWHSGAPSRAAWLRLESIGRLAPRKHAEPAAFPARAGAASCLRRPRRAACPRRWHSAIAQARRQGTAPAAASLSSCSRLYQPAPGWTPDFILNAAHLGQSLREFHTVLQRSKGWPRVLAARPRLALKATDLYQTETRCCSDTYHRVCETLTLAQDQACEYFVPEGPSEQSKNQEQCYTFAISERKKDICTDSGHVWPSPELRGAEGSPRVTFKHRRRVGVSFCWSFYPLLPSELSGTSISA